MRIIVTGVAGFIGAGLAQELLNAGHQVVGVDNLNDYYSRELKELRLSALTGCAEFRFVNLDLVDKIELDRLVRDISPTTIYHLAAQAGVRLPVQAYSKYVQSNLTGFSNIALAAAESAVPNFLYASSSSVYGNSTQLPYSENESGLEQISFYGSTKYTNEILAKSIARISETKFRGMRFFTVYGPLGRPDMAYFRLIHAALNKKKFHLFGDGSLRRDFTYISDVLESVQLLGAELAGRRPAYSDVVNVGGGKPHSMLDLISCINEISGRKIEVIRENSAEGDVRITIADHSLQHELTGFVPGVSLFEGVEKVFAWAKQPYIQGNLEKWIES